MLNTNVNNVHCVVGQININVFYCSGLFGMPKRSGKLKDLTKFDASFFGVHPKQANGMDPQLRLLLEVTYEALLDAGWPLFTEFISMQTEYTLCPNKKWPL